MQRKKKCARIEGYYNAKKRGGKNKVRKNIGKCKERARNMSNWT